MGNRLSKIVTRTGDDGSTGLANGTRVPKESARIEACGAIDELNSALGALLACADLPATMPEQLLEIQHDLFDLGGELAIPGSVVISAQQVERLEDQVESWNVAIAATAGICAAGRRPGRGELPHGPLDLPPRRAALLAIVTR